MKVFWRLSLVACLFLKFVLAWFFSIGDNVMVLNFF
jgi:hypothetical protein